MFDVCMGNQCFELSTINLFFYYNWAGFLIAAVIAMVVGMIWYDKRVFGSVFEKVANLDSRKTQQKMKENFALTMGSMFVCALIMGIVLGNFIFMLGVGNASIAENLVDGALVGFWAWLGFVAVTFFSGVLFEGKSLTWFKITAGYYLLTLLLMGAFLGFWTLA